MKKLLLILLCFPLLVFSQHEKRLALVIGNANYDKGELKNPVNDALLIAEILDSLEFDIILDTNIADKSSFIETIRKFGSRRPDYDVAFVYYAGHGIQVGSENYLLPTKEVFKSEYDVQDYGVSVQYIMRYLTSITDQINILVLDACRNNPFERNWDRTRSLKGGGLAKIPPPTGSLIAFSTDAGNTAADGIGENSIYCKSLCKNMLLENTSLDQVFRNVRSDVLKITNKQQRPVESSQLTGKAFYLNYVKKENEIQIINKLLLNEISELKEKNQKKENCFEKLNYSTDTTLDIITWNLEYFPKNGDNTINKLVEIIQGLDADIIALQEIYNLEAFKKLEEKLPEYSLISSGSLLRLGFLIKRNIEDPNLYQLGILNDLSFVGGRLPLLLKFKYLGEYFYIFNMHHKCCGDGILEMGNSQDEEFRRYNANFQMIRFLEDGLNKNGIILGDFNDLLEDHIENNTMKPFLLDKENYLITDYDIINQDPSNWSYPNWPSHLDHIIINKNLFDNYKLAGSYSKTLRLDKCFESLADYDELISDHLPVGIRLYLDNQVKYNQKLFKF
jgi:hypothetical protein